MVWVCAGWDSVSDCEPIHTGEKAEKHAADRQTECVYLHKNCGEWAAATPKRTHLSVTGRLHDHLEA